MRPIKLVIRGLNSFIEEQTIDFDKLTDRGLFGIIGPTGSGKSTVLDGITLALYGEVARKSSNFINTNCDSAHVSFTFQISGAAVKRYLVEREFKTDKKTGNPRSGKCKVVDITLEEPVVLADSVSGVTNVCKEAIGLTLEDFTRTVVLPQGKFSDFLKLAGKDRRDMLERLFNLQQYGDDLSRKLSRELVNERNNYNFLMGEFSGYEEVNEENKKKLETQYKEWKEKLDTVVEELKTIEEQYFEKQAIWNLQSELQVYEAKKKELKEKEVFMQEEDRLVKVAEAADKVLPYILAYEETLQSIGLREGQLVKLKEELAQITDKKEQAQTRYQEAAAEKEEQLPKLQLKEANAKEALEEKKVYDTLMQTLKELEHFVEKLRSKKVQYEAKSNDISKEMEVITKSILEEEDKCEQLKVSGERKEQVQVGLRLVEKLEEAVEILKTSKKKHDQSKAELEKEKAEEIELLGHIQKKEQEATEAKEELESLIFNCPGEAKDLIALQKVLADSKEKWNQYHTSAALVLEAKQELEENRIQAVEADKQKRQEVKNLEEDRKRQKTAEVENIAQQLRETLLQGEVCPVCGSTEHHKDKIVKVSLQDMEKIESVIGAKEAKIKELEGQITRAQTRMEAASERIKVEEEKQAALGQAFKETTVEELEEKFMTLQKSIEAYTKRKEELEKKSMACQQELIALAEKRNSNQILIARNEKLLEELRKEYGEYHSIYQENLATYRELSGMTGIENFKEENKVIISKEREREELLLKIKQERTILEERTENAKQLESLMTKLLEEMATKQTSLEEKRQQKEEKLMLIYNKVGDVEDIESHLNNIHAEMVEITKEYQSSVEQKEAAESLFQQCNEAIITVTSTLTELMKRKENEAVLVNVKLKEQNFTSEMEVKEKQLSKEEIRKKKEATSNYEEEVAKNKGAIESITMKLAGKEVSEESWIAVQEEKAKKEQEQSDCNEAKIKAESELKQMNQKLEELSGLVTKKEKLDHKLALLGDLEKLFKGKKFVEYVAATRLKYISIEASKKLKEISNGNYGLEVDENGKFIIRDYKNGGAARDASTLSGGETFITSLALALALSAEIQLKGTAPLELFFLDEGFGTLDDNLLDVVMGAIEKIHNDKLKVGLISHVDSIKNRVPVKLVLTPAEAGKGGSKVKIERN